jgi:AcrR family transcriptional regulator
MFKSAHRRQLAREMPLITKKKPRQLSREDWTEAARKQLVAAGIEEVKVDRLARKMKVTRGSFYWHFKNRKDLLDSVLRVWEAHKERELEQTRAQWATMGPLEVVRIWLSEDPTYPAFDIAIRFWAWKAPAVAKIVSAIDDRWIAFLAEQFFREGQSMRLSVARARLIYWQQIGYYAMKFEEPMQERLAYMPYYNAILLGNEGGEAADIVVTELAKDSLTKKQRAPKDALSQ